MTVSANELTTDRRSTIRQLAAYFGIAFAICWGLGAIIILARPQLEALVGPIKQLNQHWIYYLAVCAPSISAIVVTAATSGWAGLKALAGRFVRPFHPVWIAAALFLLPAALTLYEQAMRAAGMGGAVDLRALTIGAPVLAFTTLALITDPGGLGEETGWRGFALPRLLTLMGPLPAAILLGFIWGLWHLPAFFLSDLSQSQFGLGWFLAGSVALTMFMTWLFVHANGNLMVAGVIPHLLTNLLFDAHVYRANAVQVETEVIGVLVLALVAIFGPSLRGWGRNTAHGLQPGRAP